MAELLAYNECEKKCLVVLAWLMLFREATMNCLWAWHMGQEYLKGVFPGLRSRVTPSKERPFLATYSASLTATFLTLSVRAMLAPNWSAADNGVGVVLPPTGAASLAPGGHGHQTVLVREPHTQLRCIMKGNNV